MPFERFKTPEDPSKDDSIQYLPSQESMDEAYDKMGLSGASEEALNDDGLAHQQTRQAAQIDLPKIIEGSGPYEKR